MSSHLSRRQFLRMLGVSAASLTASRLISSCNPTPVSSTGDDAIKLVYSDWRTDWFPGMVQTEMAKFHTTHPNIRVFYTPDPTDVEVSLLQDAREGHAPDVFAACCTFFPILAQEGWCLDLNKIVDEELDSATKADWDTAQFSALRLRSGLQYGLPKYHGALALYYNKDYFDSAKVDYPDGSWDHDDYLTAMRLLTRDQNNDGRPDVFGSMIDFSWDRIQVYVNAWGGNLVDPADPTRSRMAEQPAMDATEWLRARIWDDRVMAAPLDVENLSTRQAFSNGRLAMVEDGSWALKDILTAATFRIGIAPLPSGPARKATLATTDGFGIYSKSGHVNEAKELIKFLISPEYGQAMARANFLQPARVSLIPYWADAIRAEYPNQASDLDLAAFADGHVNGYSVTTEIFAAMQPALRLAQDAWDKILKQGKGQVSELAAVSKAIEAAQK